MINASKNGQHKPVFDKPPARGELDLEIQELKLDVEQAKSKLAELEEQVSISNSRFTGIETKVLQMETRVDNLEKQLKLTKWIMGVIVAIFLIALAKYQGIF